MTQLRIELYSDGAVLEDMIAAGKEGVVKGFTTNPTLMRKAGVTDYRTFARRALDAIPDLPISFEVFADDLPSMEQQAREIASWGPQVFVKVPISTTTGEPTVPLMKTLSHDGIQINATAILSLNQVRSVIAALSRDVASIVSVFAGRIADTGRDPEPIIRESVSLLASLPRAKLLWASPRELFNVFQAEACGCHIITATPDILKKLSMVGMDLEALSLETVKMFHRDATAAGYAL